MSSVREIRMYNGRAFKLEGLGFEWRPMKKAEAEVMIATESVQCVTYGPNPLVWGVEVYEKSVTAGGMKVIRTRHTEEHKMRQGAN